MKEFNITYLTVSDVNLQTIENTATIEATDKVNAIKQLENSDAGFIKILEVVCNA